MGRFTGFFWEDSYKILGRLTWLLWEVFVLPLPGPPALKPHLATAVPARGRVGNDRACLLDSLPVRRLQALRGQGGYVRRRLPRHRGPAGPRPRSTAPMYGFRIRPS